MVVIRYPEADATVESIRSPNNASVAPFPIPSMIAVFTVTFPLPDHRERCNSFLVHTARPIPAKMSHVKSSGIRASSKTRL